MPRLRLHLHWCRTVDLVGKEGLEPSTCGPNDRCAFAAPLSRSDSLSDQLWGQIHVLDMANESAGEVGFPPTPFRALNPGALVVKLLPYVVTLKRFDLFELAYPSDNVPEEYVTNDQQYDLQHGGPTGIRTLTLPGKNRICLVPLNTIDPRLGSFMSCPGLNQLKIFEAVVTFQYESCRRLCFHLARPSG